MIKGRWSKKEIDYLKKNSEKMTRKEIAKELNRNVHSIYAKCRELKLGTRHYWTEKELKYILTNWELKSNEEIARVLKRSKASIQMKATELGLGGKREWYTTDEVANIFGWSNRSRVLQYIYQEKLNYKLAPYEHKNVYLISEQHIKEFARTYTDRWDTKKAHIILAMYENYPKWLKDKIESDKDKKFERCRLWTNDEDKKLERMYSVKDISVDKIAKELNRSRSSIVQRVRTLYLHRSWWKGLE